jgi:hypothetical protein
VVDLQAKANPQMEVDPQVVEGLPKGGKGKFPVGGVSVPFGFPWSSSPWNPWYPLWYPPPTPIDSFINKIIIIPNLFYWDRFEYSCSNVS